MDMTAMLGLTIVVTLLLGGGCGAGGENIDEEKKETREVEVSVLQPTMRSCELLVSNSETTTLDKVNFDASVSGFFRKRGDLTAIVFVAKEDKPIADAAVKVELSSGVVSGLEIDKDKSACFNKSGLEIDDALWRL
jgi:hypothetical protein